MDPPADAGGTDLIEWRSARIANRVEDLTPAAGDLLENHILVSVKTRLHPEHLCQAVAVQIQLMSDFSATPR